MAVGRSASRAVAMAATMLMLCAAAAAGSAGDINTVAGTGTPGGVGDGGPAAVAELQTPTNVSATPDGGYLIVDQGNSKVRRVAPDGTITTVAGNGTAGFSGDGGPATSAQLNAPNAAVMRANGDILIADSNNHRVRLVSGGSIMTVVGDGTATFGGDGGPASAAKVRFPVGLAVTSDGGYLIADNDNHRIRQVDAGGNIATVAGTGTPGYNGDGIAATSAQLNNPSGVAVMPDGGFVFTEQEGQRVRRVAPGGTIATIAGDGSAGFAGDGGPGTAATLNSPTGIAATSAGEVLVADFNNSRVREIASDGTIATIAGTGNASFSGDGGAATAAELNKPLGVAIEATGDALVADTFNHRVRRLDRAGGGGPPPPPPPVPGTQGGGGSLPAPGVPQVTAVDVKPVKKFGRAKGSGYAMATATVSGNTRAVSWTIANGGRVASFVAAPGHSAILFRARPGMTTVTATATGGFGSSSSSTTTLGEPLTGMSGVGAKVTKLIGLRPPVAVTGTPLDISRLPDRSFSEATCRAASLGGSRQGFVTVHSGAVAVTGCLPQRVAAVADIPPAERSVLADVARQAGIDLASPALDEALTFMDAYKFRGQVTVNGMSLTPAADARLVVVPQVNAIVASQASAAIGAAKEQIKLEVPKDLKINTKAVGDAIPLGRFAVLDSILKTLGSFPLPDEFDVDVKLLGGDVATATLPRALVTLKLRLPDWISKGGIKAEGEVQVIVSSEGISLEKARIGPIDADVGAVSVKQLLVAYSKVPEGDLWQGSGQACIVSTACLDMRPTFGGVDILNGQLKKVGAILDLRPLGGIQLYPNVRLDDIGFQFQLNPTVLFGRATVNVYQILDVVGNAKFVFATDRAPYVWPANDVDNGDAYPPRFSGQRFTTTTIGLSSVAFLVVPKLGRTKLGGGYLLYRHPGYVAFGGGVDLSVLGIIDLRGGTDGEINFSNGRFNMTGNVDACVSVACAKAIASVSTAGVGGCLDLGGFNIGGGVTFNPEKIHFTLWDGCRWSIFVDRGVGGTRADGPPAATVVSIKRGDASRTIQLSGDGDAPRVRITAPDGTRLESPASGFAHQGVLRVLRHPTAKITAVGLQDPPPGDYRIEPLPGSPAVAKVQEAVDPGPARVSAQVSDLGAQRVLRYDIGRRPNQRVVFTEIAGAARKVIGTVSGGGKGTLRFTPIAGTDSRRIEAQFVLDGLNAETRVVARFLPPSPRLGTVGRLRVLRRGTVLAASWAPVADAASYDVVITPTSGKQRLIRVRTPRARISGVARYAAGRVSVRATGLGSRGPALSRRFKATAKKPSRITRLPKAPRLTDS
jgi:hypothetical protein